jgi:hypothetical protein
MKPLDKLLFLSALLVGSLASLGLQASSQAADAVSRKIFVHGTNESPASMVRVEVDRQDRTYKVGEQMKVKVVSEQDGYLYLFNVDPEGEIECLFPNSFQTQNQIKANQEVEIGTGNTFVLRIGAPVGKDLIKAIVTKEPLKSGKLDELIDSKNARPRTVKAQLAKTIVVEAITGDPTLGNSPETVEKIRDKFQRDNPEEFKQRARQYAEHQVEITSVTTKDDVKPQEKRVGLFIGIDKFQDQAIRSLAVSHLDAKAMEDALRDQGKFKTYSLLNKDATLNNIRRYITEKLVQETRPGDTVVIYWSGHGGRCANTDGSSPDGFDEFLVPYDGSLDSDSAVRSSMLFDKAFARWLQALDGRKVMVILDTCHSGGHTAATKSLTKSLTPQTQKFVKGVLEVGVGAKDKPKEHFLVNAIARAKSIGQKDAAVLASSSAKQVSFERKEKDLSVMTYYVVDFINKSNRPLTLKDVYDAVKDRVNSYVVDAFEGAAQTPVFSDQSVVPPAQLKP